MPYASCDRCDRIYVVPGGRSPRDECPVCACPMRPATPAEATHILEALQQRGWENTPPLPTGW